MKIFLTVATYALGKQLGIKAAAEEFLRQVQGSPLLGFPGSPAERALLPAARTIRKLAALHADIGLYHMAGTSLPQLRSRAAWAAWKSDCDVWCTIDDDVETTVETLQIMFRGLGERSIVALPCRIRGEGAEQLNINVRFEGSLEVLYGGASFRPCVTAGTGMMLVSRGALNRLYEKYPSLSWVDESDGEEKLALFEHYRERGGGWFGEDYSFVMRARNAGIDVLAPVQGHSNHDGLALDLTDLRNVPGDPQFVDDDGNDEPLSREECTACGCQEFICESMRAEDCRSFKAYNAPPHVRQDCCPQCSHKGAGQCPAA